MLTVASITLPYYGQRSTRLERARDLVGNQPLAEQVQNCLRFTGILHKVRKVVSDTKPFLRYQRTLTRWAHAVASETTLHLGNVDKGSVALGERNLDSWTTHAALLLSEFRE